jgi:succinate-acetate transporter protein
VPTVKRFLKWVLWIALAFLVYAIFRSPEQAASIIVGGFQGIGAAFGAIFAFFDALLQQTTGTAPPEPAP